MSDGMRVLHGIQGRFPAHCFSPRFVSSAPLEILGAHSPNPGAVRFSPSVGVPCVSVSGSSSLA